MFAAQRRLLSVGQVRALMSIFYEFEDQPGPSLFQRRTRWPKRPIENEFSLEKIQQPGAVLVRLHKKPNIYCED